MHDHHGMERGSNQAVMGLEQQLRAHTLRQNHEGGRRERERLVLWWHDFLVGFEICSMEEFMLGTINHV